MIHAQFQGHPALVPGQPEQGQRQAHVVVEVPLRAQARALGAQKMGDEVFRAGLAVAAGDGHDRAAEEAALIGGQGLQRGHAVLDLQEPGLAALGRPADRRAEAPPTRAPAFACPAPRRRRLSPQRLLTLKREEDRAGFQGPRLSVPGGAEEPARPWAGPGAAVRGPGARG